MFPFNFQLSGNILDFFDQNVALCYVHIFGLLWTTATSFVYASGERGEEKKNLINSGFVRFRWNFNTMKLGC